MPDRLLGSSWGTKVCTDMCMSLCLYSVLHLYVHVTTLIVSEFCMEIDAAAQFAKGWDSLAIKQWTMTGNEYAVLSTVPLKTKERARVQAGDEVEVPRQCAIKIGSEGVPVSDLHSWVQSV